MEKRSHTRIIATLKARLISDGINYNGMIENLSEEGIYLITSLADNPEVLVPNTACELAFQLPSGEKQNLHCKVKWSYKTPPHGVTNSVGLEIIDPPFSYRESLKTLQ